MERDSPWRLVIEGDAKRNKEIVDAQAYWLKGGIGYELKRDLQTVEGLKRVNHVISITVITDAPLKLK
jgi:hypothetical protein